MRLKSINRDFPLGLMEKPAQPTPCHIANYQLEPKIAGITPPICGWRKSLDATALGRDPISRDQLLNDVVSNGLSENTRYVWIVI